MQVLDPGSSISTQCVLYFLFLSLDLVRIVQPDLVKISVHIQTSKGYEVGVKSILCKWSLVVVVVVLLLLTFFYVGLLWTVWVRQGSGLLVHHKSNLTTIPNPFKFFRIHWIKQIVIPHGQLKYILHICIMCMCSFVKKHLHFNIQTL